MFYPPSPPYFLSRWAVDNFQALENINVSHEPVFRIHIILIWIRIRIRDDGSRSGSGSGSEVTFDSVNRIFPIKCYARL